MSKPSVKALFFTDPHIRGDTPTGRRDNFTDSLLLKVGNIGKLVKEHAVDVVLVGGDLFHRPDVAESVVRLFMQKFREFGVPIYGVLGNHDIYSYNPDTFVRTMAGLMDASETILLIRPGDIKVIEKDGLKVQITGQEFHAHMDHRDPVLDYCVFPYGEGGSLHQRLPDSDFVIHVVHGMLVDKGFQVAQRATLLESIAGQTVADVTFSGDYHPGFNPPIIEMHGRLFINPGAVARLYNNKSDRTRTPAVAIVEFVKGEKPKASVIPLEAAKPANEVFFDREDDALEQKQVALANFMQTVKEAGPMEVVGEKAAIDEIAKRVQIDEAVRQEALKYIGAAQEALAHSDPTVYSFYAKDHYITRMRIINFQSHADTTIEFTPGMNVICGESDQGKTVILRALEWVRSNNQRGTEFIRWGQNYCAVSIAFSSGIEITREVQLTKSGVPKHRYIVVVPHMKNVPPFDAQGRYIAEGFGSEVPLEVILAHGMPDIHLDEDTAISLHYAEQLGGPFLLSLTGPSRAKAIGHNFGVHVLDQALKMAQKERNDLVKENSRLEAEMDALAQQVSQYDWVDAEAQVLDAVAERLATIDVLIERMNLLRKLREQRNALLTQRDACAKRLRALSNLDAAEAKLAKLEERLQARRQLQDLSQRRAELRAEQTDCAVRLQRLAHLDEAVARFAALETKVGALQMLRQHHERHAELKQKLAICMARLHRLEGLTEAEIKLQRLLTLQQQVAVLRAASQRRKGILNEGARVAQKLQHLEGLEKAEGQLQKLLQLMERQEKLNSLAERRRGLIAKLAAFDAERKQYEQQFAKLAKQFGTLLRQAGKCPFCFSPLDEEHLERITAELIADV